MGPKIWRFPPKTSKLGSIHANVHAPFKRPRIPRSRRVRRDPQPPKPASPARTTHVPTKQVVDEYVKVVGVENVARTGIRVLECVLSVNKIKGLPAIREEVCSVRPRLQKLYAGGGASILQINSLYKNLKQMDFANGVLRCALSS